MKRYLKVISLSLAVLFIVSCGGAKLEEENNYLREINEELLRVNSQQEDQLNGVIESMTMIMENLNEIKIRQNLISEGSRSEDLMGVDIPRQIEADLEIINSLLDDNRNRLAQLNLQLRNSSIRIRDFEQMVTDLTNHLEQRNIEIAVLQENVQELTTSNTVLVETVDSLEEEKIENLNIIEEKTTQLNTAYYVWGTRRALQDQGIIDRRGGLLGIGRTTLINSNLNTESFTRLDISHVDKIQVEGSNLQLLSLHPQDSYIVETDPQGMGYILIEDPRKFWSTTRFLVVSVD